MLKKCLSMSLFVSIILGGMAMFSALPSYHNAAVAVSKKIPVIELFTAEWCPPCVQANQVLDEVFADLGSNTFVMIKQHTSGEGGMSNAYSRSRANRFGVTGIPAAILDGKESIRANDKNAIRTKMTVMSKLNSNVDISFKGKAESGQLTGEMTYAGAPSGSKLHVILCEAFFYYHGRNGEKLHQMISRDATIFDIGINGKQQISMEIPSTMASEMLRLVAFIENDTDRISQGMYWNPTGIEFKANDTILSSMPNQMDFETQHQGFSASIPLTLSNFSNQSVTVNIQAKDSFVQIQNQQVSLSRVSQTRINATLQTGQLAPGNYTSAIEISTGNYSKTIPVSFTIVERPEIQVSTRVIDFGDVKKGERANAELVIENLKKGPIQGSLASRSRWLDFSPSEFNTERQVINVRANTRDLQAGIHEAEISVQSNGGQARVMAKINILASLLEVDTQGIDFGEVPEESLSKVEQEMVFSNIGTQKAEVKINQVPGFILASKTEFDILPGQQQRVKLAIIAEKTTINHLNEGSIQITYTDGQIEIPVKIHVREMSPIMGVSFSTITEEDLNFKLKKGETTSFDIAIENQGKGRLEGQLILQNRQRWIDISRHQFALLAGQRRTITITIKTDDLKAGIYEETIVITSNGGESQYLLQLEIIQEEIIIELRIGSNQAMISGKAVTVDPPPYIKSGTTLVPLRFISEAFGADIDWNPRMGKGTITIQLGNHFIQIEIANPNALVNGQTMKMVVPPEIVNGRTFVPLRFISEAFGAEVQWEGFTQTIRIIYST